MYPLPDKTIEKIIETLVFDEKGLIPAIAQAAGTGEVLMLAWMNRESIRETLTTGQVCYWSRSRKSLWRKGETSGHRQVLRHFRYDCDADAILLLVDQTGPACHTNRRECFFYEAQPGGVAVISDPL